MKKIMIFFIVLFSTAILSNYETTTNVGAIDKFEQVNITEGFKPYALRFYNMMYRNNINIDWTKISSINVVPLARGTQGIYSLDTHIILIQPYQLSSLSKKAYDNLLLAILAHEIGHSQGFPHVFEDGKLMSTTDIGIYDVINDDVLLEKFIIEAFIGS